jgi:hypothetical protein
MTVASAVADDGATRSPAADSAMRRYTIGVIAGAVAGLLVGGVLGRLVMYGLRLTSPAAAMGKTTDAKSTIGEWSLRTFGLLETGIALGAEVGALYILVRPWLPRRYRPLMTGIFGATAGGALFIHPHGVDYYVVKPLYLTVPTFLLLPAIFGYLLGHLVERMIDGGFMATAPTWLLWVPLIVVLPAVAHVSLAPPVVLMLLAAVLATACHGRAGGVVRFWGAPVTSWIGSRLLVVLAVVNIVVLVHSVNVIIDHPGGFK